MKEKMEREGDQFLINIPLTLIESLMKFNAMRSNDRSNNTNHVLMIHMMINLSFHRRNETRRWSETGRGEDKREGKKRNDIAYCTVSPPPHTVPFATPRA